jgi:hypothetical protein
MSIISFIFGRNKSEPKPDAFTPNKPSAFTTDQPTELKELVEHLQKQLYAEKQKVTSNYDSPTQQTDWPQLRPSQTPGPNPPDLPADIQTITVTAPTVIVAQPCTFYGYSESGDATNYGELIRIRDSSVLDDYPSIYDGQIRDIICCNYGSQPNMATIQFYQT